VFFETDGRLKYLLYRRDGESLEDYLLREKRRQEAICLATGWICLRAGWSDFNPQQSLAPRLRKVLDQRLSA
jgi:hypothetical protein